MKKKLKIWNGRGHGKYDKGSIYVAAYSIKQASELVGKACDLGYPIGSWEINQYYSPCWGNPMEGIIPTEPCVYVQKNYMSSSKPERVL